MAEIEPILTLKGKEQARKNRNLLTTAMFPDKIKLLGIKCQRVICVCFVLFFCFVLFVFFTFQSYGPSSVKILLAIFSLYP